MKKDKGQKDDLEAEEERPNEIGLQDEISGFQAVFSS